MMSKVEWINYLSTEQLVGFADIDVIYVGLNTTNFPLHLELPLAAVPPQAYSCLSIQGVWILKRCVLITWARKRVTIELSR